MCGAIRLSPVDPLQPLARRRHMLEAGRTAPAHAAPLAPCLLLVAAAYGIACITHTLSIHPTMRARGAGCRSSGTKCSRACVG
eukprot:10765786-Alexandrium_andersonii.AAC.1